MSRREEILSGKLTFPEQILTLLNPTPKDKVAIEEFWNHLWYNFLCEKELDTLIHHEQFSDKKLFNRMLVHLSKAGWISSIVDSNYCYIELLESKLEKWVTKEEITNLRYKHKFIKYQFTKTYSDVSNLVKLNNTITESGIVREGFKKAGNNTFYYDLYYMHKYLNEITYNLEKGLSGSTKDITYQEIIESLVDWYALDSTEYTLGRNVSDSRGRAIFACTKKLFNPISSKDARALIRCQPSFLTSQGFKAVYAFIAELLDLKGETFEDRVHLGEAAYLTKQLISFDNMVLNKNYDDLHKLIWLERIYANLDEYDHNLGNWTVPIEVDATASMVQMISVLTNNHQYMDETNLIGDTLKDFWTVPYCSRTHVKKAMTPILYGSSKFPTELWDNNKLPYTKDQVNKIMLDLVKGKFAYAASFKDFIINNVKPKHTMKVKIWNDEFTIKCNRFKWEATNRKEYLVYSSTRRLIKSVWKEVRRVPDLNQFKRYFVTLLLHCLDSQVADYIAKQMDWVLPNHDAFIVHPSNAHKVRELYVQRMYDIYANRHQILSDYFASIGITEEWKEEPNSEISEFSTNCLK